MYWLLLAFLILLALAIIAALAWSQWKYGRPLYKYQCEYSYSRFGEHGQYFTEILRARSAMLGNQHESNSECSITQINLQEAGKGQAQDAKLEKIESTSDKKQSFEELKCEDKSNKGMNTDNDSQQEAGKSSLIGENSQSSNTVSEKRLVFIFFSGNPGYIRFYDRYLQHMSDVFDGKYEILGIGQAGQSLHESEFHKVFTLKEQIDHKLLFFNSLIEKPEYKNAEFVFFGHSLGCYIALKLLAKIDNSRVKQILMIHPAFDRLGDTPNGIHRRSLHKYDKIFQFALRTIDSIVPISVLRGISLWNFNKEKYPSGEDISDVAETLARWLRYDTAYSFIKLTHIQFFEIRELFEEEILSVADRLTVFYAENDDWTPEIHKKYFKDQFGHRVRCLEDKLGMSHTFVSGGSLVMAKTVKELLEGKL